ncbi:transposase [Paraburkholderia tropica]|uniref:transposase n=1 Tax=Paraburkholderia tropica TaxID=92647 RepID=UPI0038BA0931
MSNAGNRAHPHRTYAQEFKQQVIRETLEPGMSVSIVARRTTTRSIAVQHASRRINRITKPMIY